MDVVFYDRERIRFSMIDCVLDVVFYDREWIRFSMIAGGLDVVLYDREWMYSCIDAGCFHDRQGMSPLLASAYNIFSSPTVSTLAEWLELFPRRQMVHRSDPTRNLIWSEIAA